MTHFLTGLPRFGCDICATVDRIPNAIADRRNSDFRHQIEGFAAGGNPERHSDCVNFSSDGFDPERGTTLDSWLESGVGSESICRFACPKPARIAFAARAGCATTRHQVLEARHHHAMGIANPAVKCNALWQFGNVPGRGSRPAFQVKYYLILLCDRRGVGVPQPPSVAGHDRRRHRHCLPSLRTSTLRFAPLILSRPGAPRSLPGRNVMTPTPTAPSSSSFPTRCRMGNGAIRGLDARAKSRRSQACADCVTCLRLPLPTRQHSGTRFCPPYMLEFISCQKEHRP